MRTTIICLLILTFSHLPTLTAKSHYLSIDSNGHPVYSDRPPEQGKYQRRAETLLNPIIWKQTPKLNNLIKRKRTKKSPDNAKQKKNQCLKLSLLLKQLQLKLKQRLSAKAFEQIKQRLILQRYQYQKQC